MHHFDTYMFKDWFHIWDNGNSKFQSLNSISNKLFCHRISKLFAEYGITVLDLV